MLGQAAARLVTGPFAFLFAGVLDVLGYAREELRRGRPRSER